MEINQIFGTQEDDNIIGTELDDEIRAQRGDDNVIANAGNDTIFGSPGDDTVSGGEGNDSIFAWLGEDLLSGDEGNDFIRGQGDNDTLNGGSGNDTLIGGDGSDRIFGQNGNDRVVGENGNDLLAGGQNDDTLFGGSGNDIVLGQGGNDSLLGERGNDTLEGGSGRDRLIGVDIRPNVNSNFGRNNIDILEGGTNNDTFVLGQQIDGEDVVFYNNTGSNGLGTGDYAIVRDFETNRDTLELVGSFSDYSFAATPEGLPDGVGVYLGQESNFNSELIAILRNVGVSEIADIQTNIDPIIEFGSILQTPTLIPEEQGRLEVSITNPGNLTNTTLNLYASTDRVLDNEVLNTLDDTIEGTNIDELQGTDELLGTINIDLLRGENTFTIDFASGDFDNPSVVSPGGYNLIAEVDLGNGNSDVATQFISSDDTDVVLDWNSAFLNAVQAEGKIEQELGVELGQNDTTLDNIRGVAPPVVARNGAILHTAIYEAVNALSNNPGGSSLNSLPSVTNGASQEAAAVGAAYTVLSDLFVAEAAEDLPEGFLIEQQTTFDLQRDRSLAEITDTPAAENSGFNFGVEIAETILAERRDDGAAQAQVSFTPGAFPLYQEVTERGRVAALLPNWGEVEPFAIDSVEPFKPENLPERDILGLPEFNGDEYTEQINEVARVGALIEDTEGNPVDRTDDQTEIAQFWSYDRADTFRPTGQWNQIAQETVLSQEDLNLSIEDNALLFAQLNIAMADAGIVTWDVKYEDELLRPFTALNDSRSSQINPDINVDPDGDWRPLIGTPDFPDYISGHSAFGGAAAGVLEDFFGDDVVLELPTQELPGVTRTFTGTSDRSSFVQAAFENADSRLFGGVHIDASNLDGVEVGLAVADNVLNEGNIFA